MSKSEEHSYKEQEYQKSTRLTPLVPRASAMVKLLGTIHNDRMPAEIEQGPEVERRRHQDVRRSISTLGRVLMELVRDLEKAKLISNESFRSLEEYSRYQEQNDYEPFDPPGDFDEWLQKNWEWTWQSERFRRQYESYFNLWWNAWHELGQRVDLEAYAAGHRMYDIEKIIDGMPGMKPGTGTPQAFEQALNAPAGGGAWELKRWEEIQVFGSLFSFAGNAGVAYAAANRWARFTGVEATSGGSGFRMPRAGTITKLTAQSDLVIGTPPANTAGVKVYVSGVAGAQHNWSGAAYGLTADMTTAFSANDRITWEYIAAGGGGQQAGAVVCWFEFNFRS